MTEDGAATGNNTIALVVVEPTGIFLHEKCELAVVMTSDGERGFMKGHEPVVMPIRPGSLRFKIGDIWKACFISVGYVEVTKDRITVMTNAAEWPDDIDVQRAEEALERAEKRMKNPDADAIDLLHGRHAVRRAKARLHVSELFAKRVKD